jgi:hypothetical protein
MEKIDFIDPISGEADSFYVLEETTISGSTYLLVTVEEDEDSEAYIMKQITTEEDETTYEILEDDAEIEAISKVFMEMLEDTVIE